MKYSSLDTNLILALLNNKDRLNKTSTKIIKKETKPCALCKSALREARIVARDHIARAVANSLDIIVDIKDITDPKKRENELKRKFDILIKKDVQLKNFYIFLYDKIISYMTDIGINALPRYLSNLSEHVARTFEPELKKLVTYSYISIDFSNNDDVKLLTNIKTHTSSIHYKDTMDYKIFCEMAVNLSEDYMIDFYTDDKEFFKKSKKAFNCLEKNIKYNHSWFTIIHTEELT